MEFSFLDPYLNNLKDHKKIEGFADFENVTSFFKVFCLQANLLLFKEISINSSINFRRANLIAFLIHKLAYELR